VLEVKSRPDLVELPEDLELIDRKIAVSKGRLLAGDEFCRRRGSVSGMTQICVVGDARSPQVCDENVHSFDLEDIDGR